MIPWWWALLAFAIGEAAGILVCVICAADPPKEHRYIRRR